MILVQKITLVAFSYHDGNTEEFKQQFEERKSKDKDESLIQLEHNVIT